MGNKDTSKVVQTAIFFSSCESYDNGIIALFFVNFNNYISIMLSLSFLFASSTCFFRFLRSLKHFDKQQLLSHFIHIGTVRE